MPDDTTAATAAGLDDVLVVTTRKGFWARPECERFPHRVETPLVRGHSTSLVNTTLLALRVLAAIARRRPRVLLFGTAHRLVPVALVLRRLRLLPFGLVVTNQVRFGPRLGRHADRVVVFSRAEAMGRPTYRFVPIPVDAPPAAAPPGTGAAPDQPFVFAGGGTRRDFPSLVAAVDGTALRLVLVTDSPAKLGLAEPLPPNCDVRWRMPLDAFLWLLAQAAVVAVPLEGADAPHGHTTIAQALRAGKAVVTTRCPAVEDYVRDGVEGLLVEPGDVAGYRDALERLVADDALRRACEEAARAHGEELTFERFADALEGLALGVLAERSGAQRATDDSSSR